MSDTVRDFDHADDASDMAKHHAHRTDAEAVARVHHAAVLDTRAAGPAPRWFAEAEGRQAAHAARDDRATTPATTESIPTDPSSAPVASPTQPARDAIPVAPADPSRATVRPEAPTGASMSAGAAAPTAVTADTSTSATTGATTTGAAVPKEAVLAVADPANTIQASTSPTSTIQADSTAPDTDTVDAAAAFFTAGDLVISVYGDGAGTGTYGDNQAAPIVLEELTTSGAFVTEMTLPQATTVVDGVTEYAVSGEYGSSSEGTLELSADGRSLVIAGYAVNAATYNAGGAAVYGNAALAQSTSIQGGQYTAVARVIADINADGVVDSSTALYNVANTNNPRSVATVDGSTFYISGQGVKGDATQGVFVATDGASSATAIDTSTDTRTVEIYNGTLYVSRDSKQNNSSSIASYGGLPTASTAATVLPGIAGTVKLTAAQENMVNASAVGTKINLSPENYVFANSTTLYVADSGLPKTGSGLGDGGLQKWSLVGGTWTLDYTLSSGLNLVANTASAGTTGLIGLTGTVVGGTVYLYATNATIGDLDSTYLFGITDTLSATTNPGESFTTLMTAAADTNIRGVAFAPNDTACYAAGTRILCDRGERPVESLRAGDVALVRREDGGVRPAPIRWVGQRVVDIARHPDPDRVRPISFAPDAIADGVPSRPLVLSPDHALLLDGALVPARLLVNGTSITVLDVERVTYVHVELDRHDILLAENVPAESYLDTGNRHQFAGGDALSLHPRFDRDDHPEAYAPLATDASIVAPIHHRLAERAGASTCPPPVTRDPGLVLVLPCGRAVAPARIDADGRHVFWLDEMRAPVQVLLRSRGQSPASLRPWLDDRRCLGVGIAAIAAWTRDTGLDPVSLLPGRDAPSPGWWPTGGGDASRWTDGEATLALPSGCLRLDVIVSATAEYALAG